MTTPLRILVAIVGWCAAASLAAQENKPSFVEWLIEDVKTRDIVAPRHPMPMGVQSFPQKEIDTTIDAQSYTVYFDWYMPLLTPRAERPRRKATAYVTSTVRSRVNDLPSVVFDAIGLEIDSVTSPSGRLQFQKTARTVTVNLPAPIDRGQDVTFTIHYAILNEDNGLYMYAEPDAAANNVPYASCFTFSQPENSRRWFPCNDQPDDKALFTARLRVPKGYTAVSNGVQIDSVADGDTATIQTWHHDVVMSTYLFAVNASKYVMYPQEYRRPDNSVVPIANYHFDVDQDGPFFNATNAVRNVPLMFEALESYFGRYPYTTYGHVAVSPVPFGGMEHQTMTTVNRIWLNGSYDLGYAHEVAHHWIGDDVTCATWADIWLNEGGASWSEALYDEYRFGRDGYMAVMNRNRSGYLQRGLAEPPIYDIPIANIFNVATTYYKASWVYHMMRRMVGDSVFFPVLRDYIAAYAKGSAQTYEFQAFLKARIPTPRVDWDTFFDQWLVKAGHPVFDVVARDSDIPMPNTYRVTVAQTQQAENVPDVFIVPLQLRFLNGSNRFDTTVLMSQRSMVIDITLPFQLDSVAVNPDRDILSQQRSSVVSADEDPSTLWCVLAGSHPITAGEPLRLALTNVDNAVFTIRSISGETLGTTGAPAGVVLVPTDGLAPGMYVVTVTSGTRMRTIPFVINGQ